MERNIYLLEAFLNIASQFIVPFITLYAIYLGYSNLFVGTFNSLLNISHLLTFFISFFLIDLKNIRKALSISLLIWGLSFVFLYYARSEYLFLLLTLIRSISSSIISTCYTWIISKVFKKRTFEKISNLTIIYTLITLFTILTSGILINKLSYLPVFFYIPLVFSILSILLVEKIILKIENDTKPNEKEKSIIKYIRKSILNNLKNRKLRNYSLSIFLFYFSVGIAGPFFSVFLKRVLMLGEFEWAIITCVEMLSFLIFSSTIKKIKRVFNIITLFKISIFLITLNPLVWVASKNFGIILLYGICSGTAWQLFSISHLTFISKNFGIIRKISFINVFLGTGLIIGNLLGGIIAQIKIEYVFYLSFICRFFSSLFFSKNMEEKKISIEDVYKNIFISIDFFSSLIKEFALQFKSLSHYNHKKNKYKF